MIAAGTSVTHTQAALNNLIGYVATCQPCYVTLPHTINRMVLNFEARSLMYISLYIYIVSIYIYIRICICMLCQQIQINVLLVRPELLRKAVLQDMEKHADELSDARTAVEAILSNPLLQAMFSGQVRGSTLYTDLHIYNYIHTYIVCIKSYHYIL